MLGTRTGTWALLPFQLAVLVGTPCVYVITGADNLVSFITLVTGERRGPLPLPSTRPRPLGEWHAAIQAAPPL